MRDSLRLRPARLIAVSLALAGCAGQTSIEREPPRQAQLTTRVKVALAEAQGIDAAAVFVEAGGDGQVRLGGFADSAEARQQAARVATGVKGVSRVDNRIELR